MTHILSQNDFYSITGVSVQMDYAWLGKQIEYAQLDSLQPCLGEAFYNEIILQTETNTLTVSNAFLLERHVKRFIAYEAYAKSFTQLWLRPEAKGFQNNNDSTSRSASAGEAMKYQMEIQNRSDEYKLLMLNFLIKNKEQYPLYEICPCNDSCFSTNFPIFTGNLPRNI